MKPNIISKLRSLFLSPNSKLELWLRTQYHQLNKTHLFFKIQDFLARRSYQRFRDKQKKTLDNKTKAFQHTPKVSFLITCHISENYKLLKTINSIRNVKGDNWETIVFIYQQRINNDLQSLTRQDSRFKLVNSNKEKIIDFISGDFIILCQPGDQFHGDLLFQFYTTLSEDDSADWYYYDCELFDEKTENITPLCKPSTLSPELLLSVNYLSRGFIRSSYFFNNSKSIHEPKNLSQLEYRLALFLKNEDSAIRHIPHFLIRQNDLVKPNSPEIIEEIIKHLSDLGLSEVTSQHKTNNTCFTWYTNNPSVAIIIPTRNNKHLLEPCINSLFDITRYQNFTVHIVDNTSDNPDTLSYYQTIVSDPRISIHPYNKKFNYSQANNLGAAKSVSDLILFLNDDIEIFDPDWLSELIQWAIRPEIGVVGAKLLRENKTVQHAGIIMGLVGLAGHIYLNAPDHYQGLFGSVDWYRNYLAVTGACQMVRRELFNEVGGYDEEFQLAFGDIDFCLRIHDIGYRNIYTPFARLYHYEGKSRGYSTPVQDIIRAYNKHEKYLEKHDPYFSPNLTYTRIPKCTTRRTSGENRKQQIEERKKFYLS